MNDDEQLELDLPEPEEDLSEEGLDEYVKRNEERNQRDYEENKYRNRELQRRQEERKRQQLDIPGLFEARSGLRTTAALGTEIFLNTLVDPVLEPGTQIAAGSLINALAQRIRGGKFSPGEVTAAGLASLIPGGAQGRALTQVLKGGAKGAASGAIETTGMALVDEGRPPTKEELAAGLGIGFAFGGALSTPGAIKTLQDLRGRIKGQYTPIVAEAAYSGPTGSGPTGKITYRNIPNLDSFLSGQTTSLDRTTAGLIQNPNFKLGDFLQGIDQELERVRRQYPNIDVDTNLQRFKWQWHHINPDKMPVDFYVGLNNVNDRNLITDTLLRETNVSAGMNPSNRIGLPTEVHDEITDWLDTEIGRRSEVITQKISDDLGFGLTLTGRGSRAAKLRFNQLFAQVPVQQRIPYIIEYGQKIAESTEILDELMRQFDIFYDIPNGYRLDVDVDIMERMLSRLDEGQPTIQTLRDIIEEVTDGMRIPVSDNLGRQGIAVPRDPNLIRAIDIEGQLRDAARGQSVLNQRQIRSLQKELNQIYQMDLDIKGASTSAYIRAWYNDRFGGTRRSGTRTGPN